MNTCNDSNKNSNIPTEELCLLCCNKLLNNKKFVTVKGANLAKMKKVSVAKGDSLITKEITSLRLHLYCKRKYMCNALKIRTGYLLKSKIKHEPGDEVESLGFVDNEVEIETNGWNTSVLAINNLSDQSQADALNVEDDVIKDNVSVPNEEIELEVTSQTFEISRDENEKDLSSNSSSFDNRGVEISEPIVTSLSDNQLINISDENCIIYNGCKYRKLENDNTDFSNYILLCKVAESNDGISNQPFNKAELEESVINKDIMDKLTDEEKNVYDMAEIELKEINDETSKFKEKTQITLKTKESNNNNTIIDYQSSATAVKDVGPPCLFCNKKTEFKKKNSVILEIDPSVSNSFMLKIWEAAKKTENYKNVELLERLHDTNKKEGSLRYHEACFQRFYKKSMVLQRGRPHCGKVAAAMEKVFNYLDENKHKSTFLIENLKKVLTDYVPYMKTIQVKLKERYGDDNILMTETWLQVKRVEEHGKK